MARENLRKKRNRQTLIIITVVFALILSYLFIFKQRTMLLHEELYTTKVSGESYIFKEEEYITIPGQKIDYTIEEGSKIGANTILSENYTLETNQYIDEAIEVIDFRLSEYVSYEDQNVFIDHLQEVSEDVQTLEDELSTAKSQGDDDKALTLEKELEDEKYKEEMMEKSIRYIFADEETLTKLRAELVSKKNNSDKALTISNLNFSFTGNIYYETTGYEDVLNVDVMPAITSGYFEYIEDYEPEAIDTRENNVIKIVNNEILYVCAFLDADTLVSSQSHMESVKEGIYTYNDIDKEGGYYDFLRRRIDILGTFPSIRFEDGSGTIYRGNLVDIVEYNNQKVLVIAIKDDVEDFMTINKTEFDVYTEETRCFVIPKGAVINKDDKTYLSVMQTGKFKELVEVNIFKYEGSQALIRLENNPDLEENMEIIINP